MPTVPDSKILWEEFPTKLKSKIGDSCEDIHLVGSNSWFSLVPFFSDTQDLKRPQLLVLPSESEMNAFTKAIEFFKPQVDIPHLTGFDVSPYSQLYPHSKKRCQRMHWLYKAQKASSGDLFLATPQGLIQRTLPRKLLSTHIQTFQREKQLPPNFFELLHNYSYLPVSYVEDFGTYSTRGGIMDIYSPAHQHPLRIELTGDTIESIRLFDPISQRSLTSIEKFVIIPTKESLLNEENKQQFVQKIKQNHDIRPDDLSSILYPIKGIPAPEIDFYLPYLYPNCDQVLNHFSQGIDLWLLNPLDLINQLNTHFKELKKEWESNPSFRPPPNQLFVEFDQLQPPPFSRKVSVSKIDLSPTPHKEIHYLTEDIHGFTRTCQTALGNDTKTGQIIKTKFSEWSPPYKIFISSASPTLSRRLEQILKDNEINYEKVCPDDYLWQDWLNRHDPSLIYMIPRPLNTSLKFTEEKVIFLQAKNIFGHHRSQTKRSDSERFQEKTQALSFGDLSPGNPIIHKFHGIGIFKELTLMPVSGCLTEFIQIEFKDKDKLYLPIYRVSQIQKYSGPFQQQMINKLGGSGWTKVKTKLKRHLKDMTMELLELYARRTRVRRPAFQPPDNDYFQFEDSFTFEETEDQAKAIQDILLDLTKDHPMDRLICGDVGFGKTEVAMRAAFMAVQSGRQVALIAPTTVLTLQHFENFKNRFKDWPIEVRLLNRLVERKKAQDTLDNMRTGFADIVIGTHRLLSKDIQFKNLGLLIVDEEQKFGVKQKEKIKNIKLNIDTIALSATPIPRTMNMSLLGLRDISLINTPPMDRLPIRTFLFVYKKSIIKKAIETEISRGGQVFCLHNRVHSIESVALELRELLPNVRFATAHGQMEKSKLEEVMIDFLNHKIDVLICTTIIESGLDIPRANTIIIKDAQQFGLSQLYQLRGRIGRRKERAYCYLLIPPNKIIDKDSQEKLRVLQENTALGSGLRIAQHDLEIRGGGDFLGESQSGHLHSVGYDLYMEILEDTIREQKGEPPKNEIIEPEINVRIPAYIPDKYIPDIRIRLAYYKILSNLKSPEDLNTIESDLQDQFGPIPEEVLNLMGLMLIRKDCKYLGIQELSSGKDSIVLNLTPQTPLSSEKMVELSLQKNKKYKITSNHRLNIRIKDIQWPRIYEEISYLKKLCV